MASDFPRFNGQESWRGLIEAMLEVVWGTGVGKMRGSVAREGLSELWIRGVNQLYDRALGL